MEGTARIWFTPQQRAELWERWKNGQCVANIARALERRNKSGVYRILALNGGIAPEPRRRAAGALRLEEREEISRGIAGGAAAWPLVAAAAQQSAMPVVGFLGTTTPDDFADRVTAFREGLKEVGYVEGQNVVIEYRWPEGNYDRLPTLAAGLVRHQVAVIAAVGGEPSPLAAKAATSTIPIVFSIGGDPIRLGLVANLNRPGGNITGVNFFQSDLGAKRLGLLHELLPKATAVGILVNPTFTDAEAEIRDAQKAAVLLGLQTHIVEARTVDQFDTAFATLAEQKSDALLLANDAFFLRERRQLIALAARYNMPAIYFWREFALDGGLMSYSPSLIHGYRQVGVYTGRILKGEKPADLPVQQPTKFEFVINLKIAKALGLTFPVLVGNSISSEPDANRVMLLADDSAAQIDLWSAHWTVPIQHTA